MTPPGLQRPVVVGAPLAKRAAREVRQRRGEVAVAGLGILPGKTALQSLAVSTRTRERYLAIRNSLDKHLELAEVAPQTEAQWDSEVARLMDFLFADGEPAATGEKLLAAVLWRLPSLARTAGGRMAL